MTALEQERRRQAIATIVGASELIGVHGLNLIRRDVCEMPEKIHQALLTLGATPEELDEFYAGGTA